MTLSRGGTNALQFWAEANLPAVWPPGQEHAAGVPSPHGPPFLNL